MLIQNLIRFGWQEGLDRLMKKLIVRAILTVLKMGYEQLITRNRELLTENCYWRLSFVTSTFVYKPDCNEKPASEV